MNKSKTDTKLEDAISVIAEILSAEATALKNESERDIKRLKDLTGTAKELAAVIKALEKEDAKTKNEPTTISIFFDEDGEKWAT